MALSNYTELQAAIATLLNRDDLTDAIPDFITLFEADFDADPRTAHHRRRICRSTAVIENEYESLASNYLSIQSIGLETDPIRRLKYIDPDTLVGYTEDAAWWESLNTTDFSADPAPPRFYTIVGTEIRFFPAPEATYTCDLTVYERLDPLVTADTNWLLTYFPNLYLYGSAVHSAPYLGDDKRLETWGALYEKGVTALMASDPVPTNKAALRTELVGMATANRRVWC